MFYFSLQTSTKLIVLVLISTELHRLKGKPTQKIQTKYTKKQNKQQTIH